MSYILHPLYKRDHRRRRNVAEKIEKLSYILKQVNQAQVKPGTSYRAHAPSSKSQMGHYITEEIDYLEHLQKISPAQTSAKEGNQEFKLRVDMSVAQLAYLLSLFIDTAVIQNKNIVELIRFVANSSMAKRSERVSAGSFKKNFYEVERGTREAVRTVLVR